MIKKLLKNSYFFYSILLCFFLYQKSPQWIKNYQLKNKVIPTHQFTTLNTRLNISFPINQNSLVIFWASWCGPCILEMNRLKFSTKLDHKRIFAINPFEDENDVIIFLNNHHYPFTFITHHDLADQLNINVTPTILFLEKNKIKSFSTGISLTGIWQAESFLN